LAIEREPSEDHGASLGKCQFLHKPDHRWIECAIPIQPRRLLTCGGGALLRKQGNARPSPRSAMPATSDLANWPPSTPVFLDIRHRVPGIQPLFQTLIAFSGTDTRHDGTGRTGIDSGLGCPSGPFSGMDGTCARGVTTSSISWPWFGH
jgi:hypothetical protein